MLKRSLGRTAFGAAALFAVLSTIVAGHEIPGDVTIQAWLKPEGQRLRFLVRVPLVAMRDMNYPTLGDKADGILDISRADQTLHDAATVWVAEQVDMYEGERRLPAPALLAVRASLPSDRSFATYDEALAHINGPRLPDDTDLQWKEGLLDAIFEYPIESDRSRFAIYSKLNRLGLRTVTALRLILPNGAVRAFDLHGDAGLVQLDPRWHQAAFRFVALGFEHILDGTDHLLFLFCLVVPFRRLRSLVAVVTAFTAAHSVTLIASAYGYAPDALWFPPLIETLIAASIVYMALENIVGTARIKTQSALSTQSNQVASGDSAESAFHSRWMIAFGFGLVHGFGFSFALRQTLQFAGSYLLTSLLSFNVGVELGQLLVLALLVPLLGVLFTYIVAERVGIVIVSALVAHTAWHWMTERWAVLRRFTFEWPALDLAFWASAMRWAMVAVALFAVYWIANTIRRRPRQHSVRSPESVELPH